MQNNDEILGNARAYVKLLLDDGYGCHDFQHVVRVENTAAKLAENYAEADMFVVRLAAVLHDIDDRKISPITHKNKDRARDFMELHGVDNATAEKIINIIKQIDYAGTDSVMPNTIEGKCVQDADRLDAIGAVGIARCFTYSGNKGIPMHDPDILPKIEMNGEEYRKTKSTAVNHFYEKLFKLSDMMNTKEAKEVAITRTAYMKRFIDMFLSECRGEDIEWLMKGEEQ